MSILEQTRLARFINQLEGHAVRKAKLYDGVDRDMSVEKAMMYLIEEVGEVSTALSRDRLSSATDECIDVAHCAMLVYLAIMREKDKRTEMGVFFI